MFLLSLKKIKPQLNHSKYLIKKVHAYAPLFY